MYVVTNGLGWALDELEVSVVSEYADVGGLDICEYFEEREGFNVYLAVEAYCDGDHTPISCRAEIEYFPQEEKPKTLQEGEFQSPKRNNYPSAFGWRKVFRFVS